MSASGVKLNEPNAAFDESSGDEAVAAVFVGRLLVDAVHVAGGLFFTGQIHGFGGLGLHAVGEFVRLNPCGQLLAAGAFVEVFLIELGQQVELPSLGSGVEVRRAFQVEDRVAAWPEQRALKC